ncbi:MAG: hypothetical protein ACM35G_10770 [Planctomycetaceae bacterium]
MDRTAYESRLKNLHSWAGHLWSTIEDAIPRALAELGPPGDEAADDVRAAALALRAAAVSLGDVMGAYDLLLDSVGRPRRYDEFLQGLAVEAGPEGGPERPVNRNQFARLVAELHFDAGWLQGAIHGAMIGGGAEDRLDEHLDGLATGIEEVMISYDRLQDLLGIMPARHCAFFDQMVVLEEEQRWRQRERA